LTADEVAAEETKKKQREEDRATGFLRKYVAILVLVAEEEGRSPPPRLSRCRPVPQEKQLPLEHDPQEHETQEHDPQEHETLVLSLLREGGADSAANINNKDSADTLPPPHAEEEEEVRLSIALTLAGGGHTLRAEGSSKLEATEGLLR
jgi:hypothetical protein